MIRILDLDNCIANDEWRIQFIDWNEQDMNKRYEKYHSCSFNDQIGNTHLLRTEHDIVISTARPECYRATTIAWLDSKNIDCVSLFMRPDGDHRHSVDLKRDHLKLIASIHGADNIADAYDDRPDVVKMYMDNGIVAHVHAIHSLDAYRQSSSEVKTVPEILLAAAQTYDERNRKYGNSYKRFGDVMVGMFPDGLTIRTAEDWNRMGLFVQATSKFVRYSAQFENGGHKDSAHDLINYAAMLEEMTNETH